MCMEAFYDQLKSLLNYFHYLENWKLETVCVCVRRTAHGPIRIYVGMYSDSDTNSMVNVGEYMSFFLPD